MIKLEPDMRHGCLQHVAVTIRQNHQLVAGLQCLQSSDDIRERRKPLDLRDKPLNLVAGVGDPGAVHDVRHRAVADLPVGSVAPVAQGIDHRIFEMSAPPPCNKLMWFAFPSLLFEKWRNRLGQAGLHVDYGAVEIEGQNLDFAFENIDRCHAERVSLSL